MLYQFKILADNRQVEKDLRICWGFSCLVGEKILFDTGESGEVLLSNMKKLNISPAKIEKVIISHDHFDHTGGLGSLLRANSDIEVYLLSSFSEGLKKGAANLGAEVIENDSSKDIAEGIYTTGLIKGEYGGGFLPEQALVIKSNSGLVVITGCAHPGISEIVEKVKQDFPQEKVFMVLGGFHLMEKDRREVNLIVDKLKQMGVEKVGPTHCTGEEAIEIFRKVYVDNFLSIGVGATVKV